MITTLHETSAQKTAIQTITFKVGTCALGLVLVATTPQGICAILLGSDEKALVGQLRSIFPQAALQKDSRELGEVLNRVVQFIETPTATLALLMDIGGTAFQKRAWKALREIPAGQTTTYKELALKLSATPEEIGEACAANRLAVVIPCHRVIRSDGGLAGYRWGVNRKRLLLQREQEMFPDPQSLFAMPALMKGHAPLKSSSDYRLVCGNASS
jgi:AraC family transcriptional regulator, regulatory protein of adaptative response / methylated-DNA-[protein]-cysteine methyltransferase